LLVREPDLEAHDACAQVKAAMGAILMGGPPAVSHEAAAAGLQKSVCEALGLQVGSVLDLNSIAPFGNALCLNRGFSNFANVHCRRCDQRRVS
jgi:hypothetical protein